MMFLLIVMLGLWLGGVMMVSASDLRSRGRGFDSRPFRYSSNNSGQVVHTHVPLSPSSIIWYRSKRREGNGSRWERCGLPPTSVGAVPSSPHIIVDRGLAVLYVCISFCVCMCVSACVFVLFLLFDLFFVASFSTLILLVGSFDL